MTVIGFNIWCSVPSFNKIGEFFTEIWRFNDFQNGGRPPSWILKICSFCHAARIDMPFYFLIQNFAEIRQSVDELRPPPSWIFKISIFGHMAVIGFNIRCSKPSFNKIGQFFTEIWRFNDFQNGGRPPSWILKKLQFLSCSPYRHVVMLPHTKFRWNRTIGRLIMAKKLIFKMAAAAILNFKNFNFWSRGCHRVQYLMQYTKFQQNRTIFHWDMAI